MPNTKRDNKIKKLQRSKKKNVTRKIYGGSSSQISKNNQLTSKLPNVNSLQNQLTNGIPNVNSLQNQLINGIPNVNSLQNQLTNGIPNVNSLQNQLTSKLPNVNSLQNQLTNRMTNRMTNGIPNNSISQGKNVFSNLMSVGAQIANNGINYGLNSIAKLSGTDPNMSLDESVSKLKNKAQNIANVISSTDLGNQLGEELSKATNKILSPALEKGSDIINEFAKKEEKAVIGLGANLAEDVAYPIVAPVRTALSGLQVVENATEAASEATGVLKEQVEAYNELKGKIGNTIEEITDLASKIPNSISPNSISPESIMPNSISPESITPNSLRPLNQEQSLQKISKEGAMIGGRIKKSQYDFLKPYINSKKVLKQLGGNLRTKKRKFIKTLLRKR